SPGGNAASSQPLIKIGENSNYNVIDLWLQGDFNVAGTGVLNIQSGTGNTLNVWQAEFRSNVARFISTTSSVASAGTNPPNSNNTVNLFCRANNGALASCIFMSDAGGSLTNFTVRGGEIATLSAPTSVATLVGN